MNFDTATIKEMIADIVAFFKAAVEKIEEIFGVKIA